MTIRPAFAAAALVASLLAAMTSTEAAPMVDAVSAPPQVAMDVPA